MGCDRSAKGIERMTERLDLSDDQQAQLRAIMDEQREQQDAQRQALRERIDTILTAEQITLRDQGAERKMQRRLDRMAERLELSAEQQEAMAALMQEKRADPSLNRTQMRERMAQILDEDQLDQLDDRRGRHGGGRF